MKILNPRGLGCVAEKRGLVGIKRVREGVVRVAEDFPKIFVDRRVVVDDEDAVIWRLKSVGFFHFCEMAGATGSSSVKVAPLPSPSLFTERSPPISRAALAPLCRPKPWPSVFVVSRGRRCA